MVKVRIPAVKPVARESGLILLLGVVVSGFIWASGLDAWLARALYSPEAHWAWAVRQWSGVLLAIPVALGGLFLLLAPLNWRKHVAPLPAIAAIMVMAVVLGMGLISQVTVQSLADRARPRESVLAGKPAAEALHGHSMPSGHAAMGFAYVAPYFFLRRRKPALARGFLTGGLVMGGLIGFARLVMGAHFASDVLMAGVIALALGPWWAWIVEKYGVFARRWWWGGVGLALAALVLGNDFTLHFTLPLADDFTRTKLPCPLEVAYDPSAGVPTLDLWLTGYGAPVSQIYPIDDHGVIKLRRWGIYHSLACRAVLHAPAVSYD